MIKGAEQYDAKTCSIIICTDGRRAMLADTLRALEGLTGADFEVCVVAGPTKDTTTDLLATYGSRIKTAFCPDRNLAASRNIGISLAAGDILAFIDDDAVPEPEWLYDLLESYADPEIGGAGGFVLDPGGIDFQYKFGIADRLGNCSLAPTRPMPELCFPFTGNYPHLLGTNCSFRRNVLMQIGGFDEEYEYYLDETDVCCRVVDAGWGIAQIPGARVHHRFAESPLRTERRILRSWYALVKNKLYFSLVNGADHYDLNRAVADAERFVAHLEADLRWAISQRLLESAEIARFRSDTNRAIEDGLARGRFGQRRLPHLKCLLDPPSFLSFCPRTAGRTGLVLLSREFPPGAVGGIGQYTANLAEAAAALGHPVRVVTRANPAEESLTFKAGIWVHRVAVAVKTDHADPLADAVAYSRRAADEVAAIVARHGCGPVCAPIWDAEGVMTVRDGLVPVVTTLHTPLSVWINSTFLDGSQIAVASGFVSRMLDLELEVLRGSRGIVANSEAIRTTMRESLERDDVVARIATIPHGLRDLRALPRVPPPEVDPPGTVHVLFVGRIEPRKGVDVLLEAAVGVLSSRSEAILDIVGDDTIQMGRGLTLRQKFERRPLDSSVRKRIRFHGTLEEPELFGLLAAADIVVVPSRYESFGLTALESMVFGKAVVCSRIGGLVEVVEEGVTALLAEPGDVSALADALDVLVTDPNLRDRLGRNGRDRYERLFTHEPMAARLIEFVGSLANTQ